MLVWAFKVHIWEPLHGTSLVQPMLKHLQSKGVATQTRALGFQKDGWSCGYESLHLCDEVGRVEDVDVIVTPLPKDSSRKHCASSMQIAPSESPAPSQKWMGGGSELLEAWTISFYPSL